MGSILSFLDTKINSMRRSNTAARPSSLVTMYPKPKRHYYILIVLGIILVITTSKILKLEERYMDFLELAKKRYSVRAYKPDPVEDDKLQNVLEAARLAPTACNIQPFQFIVIKTKGKEADLRRIYSASWFVQAPIIIAVCGIPSESWRRRDGKNYCDVDAAIAMDHLILAATELELGTCWVGAFNPDAARELLGLPDGVEPIAFTPLGYPADRPGYKTRKSLDEMVRYEQW